MLGFADDEHTSSSGEQQNGNIVSDNNGIRRNAVIGTSDRYNGATQTGYSAWIFNAVDVINTRLGLLDPKYFVGDSKNHRTIPAIVNASGQAVGTTSTNPTVSNAPALGWFYDHNTNATQRIGASTIVNPADSETDVMKFLQDDGFAVGTSGETSSGSRYAWAFDPLSASTQLIGLPESTYLGPNVSPLFHSVSAVSDNTFVAGTSYRSTGGVNINGSAVWIYNRQTRTTQQVGLFSPAYTLVDGQIRSELFAMNSSGLVAGRTEFQSGSTQRFEAWAFDSVAGSNYPIGFANPTSGASWEDVVIAITNENRVYGTSAMDTTKQPWVYNHISHSTKSMGLTSAEFQIAGGNTVNTLVAFSSTGFALGKAQRASGNTRADFNQTPWIYNPSTGASYAAGLTAGGYTTSGGGRWATPLFINNAGQAVGTSRLFNGTALVRDSAWFFDPDTLTTTELGNSLAVSRSAMFMDPVSINNHGQVVGIARNTTGQGDFVWLYDHATKTIRSDFDVRNSSTVRARGGASIFVWQLTDSGFVLGQNTRYSNNAEVGMSLWLYDSHADKKYDLTFSQKAGTGNAFTQAVHLAEDGTIFGEYDSYSGSTLLGRRYFYWSIPTGFIDLQLLIDGNLTEQGWAAIVRGSGFSVGLQYVRDGFLLGRGLRMNGNNLQFALVQVPEPSATCLLFAVFSAIGCARLRIHAR